MKNVLENESFNAGMEAGVKIRASLNNETSYENGWNDCIQHLIAEANKRNALQISVEELQLL